MQKIREGSLKRAGEIPAEETEKNGIQGDSERKRERERGLG